uniref:Potassium channel domain-containing protein n=1 Tax=Setaria digitata TaxID=48799 RepID=A0A915Q6K5_9BILA
MFSSDILQIPRIIDETKIQNPPPSPTTRNSTDLLSPTAMSTISNESSHDSYASPKFELSFECNDDAMDENNLLYNDYFREDMEDLFNPYDLLMRMHFPLKKSGALSQLEKFKNYWENYSFYAIWRKKFIEDHSCQEKDLWKEFFVESIPHLLINLFLTFYVVGGAIAFQLLDGKIRQEKLYNVIQFTFTTIATVGYGNIVPTTNASKLFCIFYTLVGVPLLFLSLTNIGQFIAEGYWIFLASLRRTQNIEAPDERRLPLLVVVSLLLTHSVIGGLLFHFWIDQMPVIPAIYFSFVSITTIGYGDITPTPNDAIQTLIIVFYLAIGMVIMSTFVASLYNHLRRLHYLGRNFSGAAHAEVWFGGTRMSVSELLYIVAEEFNVSPKMLYEVLHDLDDIITEATDPKIKLNIEQIQNRRQNRISRSENREFREHFNKGVRMVEVKDTLNPQNSHVVIKVDSTKCLNRIPDDQRENVMQALGMFHHMVKTKSNLKINKRRSSSASTKLHIVNNDQPADEPE